MNEQEYYETVSGKFAAYELLLAHLLRKTLAQLTETGACSLREDLTHQTNIYLKDTSIPQATKTELQRVMADICTKAEMELRSQSA